MSDASELVCDLAVFSESERERYRELSRQVWAACVGKRELGDGIALLFAAGHEIEAVLREFVPLERRCCPFLTLETTAGDDGESVELHVTGGEGVKAFLAEETARDA